MLRPLLLLLALAAAPASPTPAPAAPPADTAATLRNLGLAQLENEQPAQAAETFRKLLSLTPADPLPYADLAIAALRQQQGDEARSWIDQALAKAPGRADLLALQGDVLQRTGQDAEALAAYRKAAAAAADRVDFQYSLYRQAASLTGPEAEAALGAALGALQRLRPESLVVVVQSGQRAIAAGDRAGATKAFLRIRELLDPAPPVQAAALAGVLTALEAGDVASARVPGLRLENSLKPTPLYQRDLKDSLPGSSVCPSSASPRSRRRPIGVSHCRCDFRQQPCPRLRPRVGPWRWATSTATTGPTSRG